MFVFIQFFVCLLVALCISEERPLCCMPSFYRAIHCEVRGIAIVSCPSLRPSVSPSVTLMYRGHISWVSSKVIIQLISLASSLLGAAEPQLTTILSKGNIPKIQVE